MRATNENENIINWKNFIIEALKKIKLIDDKWSGEITIGIQDGGIRYIRRSETIK